MTGEKSRARCVLEDLADTFTGLGAALQIVARTDLLPDSNTLI